MPNLKRLVSLPPFPENDAGLQRGTLLEATHEAVAQLGLRVGDKIPVGFDGEYVRCGPFTWDIEQLVGEISNGIWSIAGVVDLSDPARSARFNNQVELFQLVS